jgi:4-amino-4-deoxy-L-arabinose transferase-like glycosyltransferase
VAAALVLLLVPTFLIQGAIANIRMPTALFTALLIYLTCRWLADEAERPPDVAAPAPDWRLAALALVAGLAAGHHGSLALSPGGHACSAMGARWPRCSGRWRCRSCRSCICRCATSSTRYSPKGICGHSPAW